MDTIEIELLATAVANDSRQKAVVAKAAPTRPVPKPKAVVAKAAPAPVLQEVKVFDALEVAMAIPAPMAEAPPLPKAPALLQLPEIPNITEEKAYSPEAVKRVQATVQDALKGVEVPEPLEKVVPLARLSKMPEASLRSTNSQKTSQKKTQELGRVQATVRDALKGVQVPEPLPKVTPLVKLTEMPKVASEITQSVQELESIASNVQEVLDRVKMPAPLDPTASIPPLQKLAEAPKDVAVGKPLEFVQAKEQLQATVTRALEQVNLPEPLNDLESLDIAVITPQSLSKSSSLHSELKVIREQNEVEFDGGVIGQKTVAAQKPSDFQVLAEQSRFNKVLAEYQRRVNNVITSNWHWQGDNLVELRVGLRFRIFRDGRTAAVKVSESSGNSVFDRAAIRAVKQVKRLPPFPKDIKKDHLDVEMGFSKLRAKPS